AFTLAGVLRRVGIDDPGNVVATSGVAGSAGAVLLAIFAMPELGGLGYAEGASMVSQFTGQVISVAIVALWAAVASAAIAWVVGLVLPMRAREADEEGGIDAAAHGGRAWELD
ncbi:MAG: ammonium transporter, partial [Sphingomonadaceae bacterium]|nr:ammonium transporter [Sphingomonadaceae bacterium]